jgi:hypothetical protein
MIAMLLAAALNSQPVATATYEAHVYIETAHAIHIERHTRAAELGRWLDQLDGERIRAAAVWTPFADESDDASPFEGQP